MSLNNILSVNKSKSMLVYFMNGIIRAKNSRQGIADYFLNLSSAL